MTELERSLTTLGQALEVPEAPDLVPAVLARIESRPAPKALPARRKWVLVVGVALLAALAATLAIPDARSALFRVLHIGGERIELVDELPRVSVAPDLELGLGERVTLEAARRRSAFDLRELDEPPDRTYLGERGTVWFLYGESERVRLLVAQTPLHVLDRELMVKKLAAPETRVERISVDGSPGVFLSGESHFLFLLDEYGQIVEESARLARDVLIWESGGVAYRLEGELEREEALRLAGSLR